MRLHGLARRRLHSALPGHGITPDQTADVLAHLGGLGYTDVRTTQHPNGRKTLQIIHATR